MIAARAAPTGGGDWLDRVVEYIDGNHDFVCSFAAAHMPTVKVVKPQATYLAWLDVSQTGDILRHVGWRAAKMTGVGFIVGIPLTVTLNRSASALLFHVRPFDPLKTTGLELFVSCHPSPLVRARLRARWDAIPSQWAKTKVFVLGSG